jgi:hypothetical protein
MSSGDTKHKTHKTVLVLRRRSPAEAPAEGQEKEEEQEEEKQTKEEAQLPRAAKTTKQPSVGKRDVDSNASETFDWKRNSFQKYVRHLFPTQESVFDAWPVEKILADAYSWKNDKAPLYLYVTAYDCEAFEKRSYIGGSRDLFTRGCQLNGMISGAPADAKKFQGFCKIVCYLNLPPVRNYSITEFLKPCKVKRGWTSRCSQLLEIAERNSLDFKISQEVFNPKSRLYSEELAARVVHFARRQLVHKEIMSLSLQRPPPFVDEKTRSVLVKPDIHIPLDVVPFIMEL